ncbi:MAG TPA: RDD family protein [Candidatus Mediterraneibacter excrementavium]|nr:RDD family protein [Candidatus Mediterraneibacter excrementavium]
MQNSCSNQRIYRADTRVFAGFWVRLAAYIADGAVAGLLVLLCRITMSGVFYLIDMTPFSGNVLFTYTWKDIILYLAGAAYYVLCTWIAGTTPGKRLFRLRVVSADGAKLSFIDVLYRETVGKFLSGLVICLGFIIAGFDREKRALHDILCDTRVIYDEGVKR